MHHLFPAFREGHLMYLYFVSRMSNLVRPSRCFELNYIIHCLCGPPSIPLSFNLRSHLWNTDRLHCGTQGSVRTPSIHRLQCGTTRYLIPFAPLYTFALLTVSYRPAIRLATGNSSPNIYAFHRYTRNSDCPPTLKIYSFNAVHGLSPWISASDLQTWPHGPLHPVNLTTLATAIIMHAGT